MTKKAKKNKTKQAEKLRGERKALLARKNIKMAEIAREMGRSQSTVQTVINLYPKKKSRYVQEHLAQRLNVPYERLWGSVDDHKSILANKQRAVND